jgi:tetratricopeptide (TPR) repeat protein
VGERELPTGSRAELLVRNAGGNPLFLEETVRMLADSGVLDGEGNLEDVAVPTSVQALIGARLDALPAPEKRAAQHASVVGMVFWSGAIVELHGGGEVEPSLEALEERDFVRAQDDSTVAEEHEWAFKHALTKDVSYARVPKGRRAHLHIRFVDWLAAHPGAGEEVVEIVAYHLEQSCKLGREVGRSETPPPIERAVEALMRAAEKAERREGIREADRFYARALELVGEEQSEQALALRLGRGGTLNRLGDVKSADELLSQVAEGALAVGRLDLRARALLGRASIATKQGRAAEARDSLVEAESIAAQVGDPSLQIRAVFQSSSLHSWFEPDLDTAVAEIRRGLEIAEELDEKALRIEGHMRLQVLLYNVGELAGAEEQILQCFALLDEFGSLRYEAQTTWLHGLVKYHLGELAEAERLGLQAQEWLERTGERYYQLQNRRALALCALARSDLSLAERRLRDAVPLALELGGWLVVEIYRCLIDVLIRQGRLEDARELAVFAFRNVPEEDGYARAAGMLIEAGLRTAEGQRDLAIESFTEALRQLEEQRLPLDLGEARLAYGRALRQLGDGAAAQEALSQAREDLAGMGARGLVAEIDRELAGLAEGAEQLGPLASP